MPKEAPASVMRLVPDPAGCMEEEDALPLYLNHLPLMPAADPREAIGLRHGVLVVVTTNEEDMPVQSADILLDIG